MAQSQVPPGINFLYEEAFRELDEQLDWIDALDTKAGIILAAGGVTAGLVLTGDSVLIWAPPFITIFIVVALAGSLILALLAFATRHYELAPDIDDLWPAYSSASNDELRWAAFPGLLEARDINQPKVDQKAALLFWAGVSLLLGVLLFAGFFVWFILSL